MSTRGRGILGMAGCAGPGPMSRVGSYGEGAGIGRGTSCTEGEMEGEMARSGGTGITGVVGSIGTCVA